MKVPLLPRLQIDHAITAAALSADLARVLAAIPHSYLKAQRWFGSKSKEIAAIRPRDCAILQHRDPIALLALLDVTFVDGTAETYFLPLAARAAESATALLDASPTSGVPILESPAGLALLYEAFADVAFCRALFRQIAQARPLRGATGEFRFLHTSAFPKQPFDSAVSVRLLQGEQSNTSVVFDEALILKSFRKLQRGVNPDLEVTRFLTTRTSFRNTPLLAGYVEYAGDDGFQASIGALQHFVANEGDGWSYTQAHLLAGFAHARANNFLDDAADAATVTWEVAHFSADYLREIRRLGQITGDLHRALASDPSDPHFAPVPLAHADLVQWVDQLAAHISTVLQALAHADLALAPPLRTQLRAVRRRETAYRRRVAALLALDGLPLEKIRLHGDYHLGQVLRVADDFVIIDFEGEPARSLEERRARHIPLKDVAGMLRSFSYAAHAALFQFAETNPPTPSPSGWTMAWQALTREAYLAGYLGETLAHGVRFLPPSRALVEQVIAIFELDKAIYELDYEANNRPDWLRIPLQYLAQL